LVVENFAKPLGKHMRLDELDIFSLDI